MIFIQNNNNFHKDNQKFKKYRKILQKMMHNQKNKNNQSLALIKCNLKNLNNNKYILKKILKRNK